MELTAREIEGIPRANLRVSREDFVAVWAEAERQSDENKRRGRGDWYVAGVVTTCRWIACTMVVFNYPHGPVSQPAAAPITHTTRRAHEELIERETLAAEVKSVRGSSLLEARPGWIEAVIATLHWAWRGTAGPPVKVDRVNAN